MRSRLVAGAALLALWLVNSIAHAEVSTLARVGDWEAFGGTTVSNRPVCGVSTSWSGRYLGIKFFQGEDTFTIHMSDHDWRLADQEKKAVTMQFDGWAPWNGNGTGLHFNDGDAGLELDIEQNELEKFMSEFRASNQLRLRFPDSGMDDWVVSLAGTNAVSDEFQRCVRDLK